jgi:hypothetical protein
MDTLSVGSWVRGALVVALLVDVLGQLVGVVPSGSVGMALSVVAAGVLAVVGWCAVRWSRHSSVPTR